LIEQTPEKIQLAEGVHIFNSTLPSVQEIRALYSPAISILPTATVAAALPPRSATAAATSHHALLLSPQRVAATATATLVNPLPPPSPAVGKSPLSQLLLSLRKNEPTSATKSALAPSPSTLPKSSNTVRVTTN
jgi:hypothetical protein